jgi:hypothetical protein
MAIIISLASRFIRWKSHAGALPPWSGRCAIPVLIVLKPFKRLEIQKPRSHEIGGTSVSLVIIISELMQMYRR